MELYQVFLDPSSSVEESLEASNTTAPAGTLTSDPSSLSQVDGGRVPPEGMSVDDVDAQGGSDPSPNSSKVRTVQLH